MVIMHFPGVSLDLTIISVNKVNRMYMISISDCSMCVQCGMCHAWIQGHSRGWTIMASRVLFSVVHVEKRRKTRLTRGDAASCSRSLLSEAYIGIGDRKFY